MTAPLMTLVVSVVVLAVSVAGMLRGQEPWATWFYPLAWYPTLLAADAVIRMRSGHWFLLRDWRFVASLCLWSVPFWLFFELVNFRVANWYYVFAPADAPVRWIGIVLSFGTVLPAVLVSHRLAADLGLGRRMEWRARTIAPTLPFVLQVCGLCLFSLALLVPRFFFPLVWGAVTLLVDPWVYRRDPERSLLGALERGRPALIVQLLLGGLAIGFLWELYNTQARAKWIYTVPGLEDLKLFEMPVLGFLGFPVLALDGWAAWNALVLARVAWTPSRGAFVGPRAGRALRAGMISAVLCVAVLAGMDRWTVASVTPPLEDVVGTSAPLLRAAGYDVFSLAEADSDGLEVATGQGAAQSWVRRAELVVLRGIGVPNARRLEEIGVSSVDALSSADPAVLYSALISRGAEHVSLPRVEVWVRGAQGRR